MNHSRFDILADINLKLIKDEDNWLTYYRFINENGERLDDYHEDVQSLELAKYMHYDCGLTTYPSDGGDICRLTKKGLQILDQGGWLKYLEQKSKLLLDNNQKEIERQELKDRIDILTADNLEYQNSKIELESQIQKLTRDNLRLNNWDVRFRWLIAIITFLVGLIAHYLISK